MNLASHWNKNKETYKVY